MPGTRRGPNRHTFTSTLSSPRRRVVKCVVRSRRALSVVFHADRRGRIFSVGTCISFTELEYGARRAPVYMVSGIKVCLNCGFANLHVPSAELVVLRECHAALESR